MSDVINMPMAQQSKTKRVLNLITLLNTLENQLVEITLTETVDLQVVDSFINMARLTSDKIAVLLEQQNG